MGQGQQLPNDWQQIRERVLLRDNERCRNCASEEDLEVHHVVPVSRGGVHSISNLITLCKSCHIAADSGRDTPYKNPESPQEDLKWATKNTELSPQEARIILLEKEGLTNTQIANELETTKNTVSVASARINRKARTCIQTLRFIGRDIQRSQK